MQIIFEKNNNISDDLANQIERACADLIYISDTDAPVTSFIGGPASNVNVETILAQTNLPTNSPVEEIDARAFFSRPTKIETWHTDADRERTKKFLELQTLLEEYLSDVKVFKIGRIRVDIYIVGVDQHGDLLGIKTQAVET